MSNWETTPADAGEKVGPFTASTCLTAYFLGVGLVWVCLGALTESTVFARITVVAVIAQVLYSIGGVVLAYGLSSSKGVPKWLTDCGVVKPQPGHVIHGLITGAGLHALGLVLIVNEIRLAEDFSVSEIALIGIIAPFMEDIVFQGFLYRLCRARFGVSMSILLASLVAVISHGWSLELNALSISLLFGGEAVFCLYREFSGSLWATTACHGGSNVMGLLFDPMGS